MEKEHANDTPNPDRQLADTGIIDEISEITVPPLAPEITNVSEVAIAERLAILHDEIDALQVKRVAKQNQLDQTVHEFKEIAWEIEDAEAAFTFPSLAGDPIAFARHKGLRAKLAPLIKTIRTHRVAIAKLDTEITELDTQILSLEAIKY